MSQPPPDPQPPYLMIMVRWVLVAVVVFAATWYLGIFIGDDVMPQTFEATAEIEIHHTAADPSPIPDLSDEMTELRSSHVLLPVIERLDLEKHWADTVSHDSTPLSDDDAVAFLNSRIELEWIRETAVIRITAMSNVAPLAATIPNAIVDEYKAQQDADQSQRMNIVNSSFDRQIAEQQKVVDDLEAKVTALQAAKNPSAKDEQDKVQNEQVLDALRLRRNQVIADETYEESPVKIISRAEPPTEAAGRLTTRVISGIVAVILAISVASFVEVATMLTRASIRT